MSIETIRRRRIEVLVDAPLARRVVDHALAVGIAGYTLMPTLEGQGGSGHWTDDQLSGAQSKLMFLSVTNAVKADAFVDRISPLLDSYGLVLLLSDVDVVRANKF